MLLEQVALHLHALVPYVAQAVADALENNSQQM